MTPSRRCFPPAPDAAAVPSPVTPPPRPLSLTASGLSLGGYRVEISEMGLRSQLEVATPDSVIYRGPEPGQFLRRAASAILLLAGLPVLLALLLAVRLTEPRPGVALCLLAASVGYGLRSAAGSAASAGPGGKSCLEVLRRPSGPGRHGIPGRSCGGQLQAWPAGPARSLGGAHHRPTGTDPPHVERSDGSARSSGDWASKTSGDSAVIRRCRQCGWFSAAWKDSYR